MHVRKPFRRTVIAMLAWWSRLGIVGRLIGVSFALVLTMQLALLWLMDDAISTQARQQVAKELEAGERVWQSLLARNATRLSEGAALLAATHEFRTAMARRDLSSMHAALEANGHRIGAQVTALFDASLQMSASNPFDEVFFLWLKEVAYPQMGRPNREIGASFETDAASMTAMLQKVAKEVVLTPGQTVLALLGEAPYQFVMTPVLIEGHGRPMGWILMGFALDQALADELFRVLSVHSGVLARPDGRPTAVVFETLGPALRGALGQIEPTQTDLLVDGVPHLARQLVLPALNGEVRAVLLRSVADVAVPFRRLQWSLASMTILGLAIYAWIGARATRRVTQPLLALHGAVKRLEQGQFDAPIVPGRGRDEVSELARGFVAMRSSLAEQQAEIQRLAYRDRLTGLPTRQRFAQAVDEAIAHAQMGGQSMAVIALNLDRFKHVNEVLGHRFGDQLLVAVAERLTALAPRGVLLARLGGDEFGLLVEPATADDAMYLTHQLTQRFEESIDLGENAVDLSASIGVALWPDDASEGETLINCAEIAMRWAKRRSIGVQRFANSLDTSSPETLSLLSDLRKAMSRNELRLYLQPKLELSTRTVSGAEALVRWDHPSRGLVPPLAFIGFAEQTGFVRQITRWVLQTAVSQWRGLQRGGQPLSIAVNLSTRDLMDPDLPGYLQRLLQTHDVPASALGLEITESAIMDDPGRAETTLNTLADLGFKLSIDDFGTGYSSLGYLKRLPVHELKIDQSFVKEMAHNSNDATIVRSTIELAHNLGLRVVAEGVENAAALNLLEGLGCDQVQGYHIGRPMPLEDFARFAQSLR